MRMDGGGGLNRKGLEAMAKRVTEIVVAAAVWLCAAPSAAEPTRDAPAVRTVTHAPLGDAEREWRRREREQRLRVMRTADRAAITWGNERNPNVMTAFKLNTPLARSGGKGDAEIEIFATGVDDEGRSELESGALGLALGTWWPSIEEAGLPVTVHVRYISRGPGLDSRYEEHRRTIMELITGGAGAAAAGDARGAEVVRRTVSKLYQQGTDPALTREEANRIIAEAGYALGEWREATGEVVKAKRRENNARWSEFVGQYLEHARPAAQKRPPLGRGAAPMILVNGKHLVTTNTIWQQGGLRGTEKLFQVVNSLLKQELGQGRDERTERQKGGKMSKEKKMNATATALATAMVALTIAQVGNAGELPSWKGQWKGESGSAKVVDEAHIRMAGSGTVLRMIGIARLKDPEKARIAKEGIASLIEGKKLDCWWLPKPAAEGNPMAAAPDGTPLVSCGVREVQYAKCKAQRCQLQVMVVAQGYAIPEGGAWEQRSGAASRGMAILTERQAEARSRRIGIWAGNDQPSRD